MTALAEARPPNQLQIQSASPAHITTRMPLWTTVESVGRKLRASVLGLLAAIRVTEEVSLPSPVEVNLL